MRRFIQELKRRRVFHVAAVYGAVGFVVLQVASMVVDPLELPTWTMPLLIVLIALGFPVALVIAWAFQMTPDGVVRTETEADAAGPRSSRGRMAVIAVAALLLIAAAAWWLRPRGATARVARGADVIAVLPFTTSGAGVERLGEGMVDLLSTNLDGVGGIRMISPRTILHQWHGYADEGMLGLQGSLAIGRKVGAGSVLLGSVVAVGGDVRMSAELHTVEGETIGRASVEGPEDAVLALVDSLSIRLVRDVWRSRAPIPNLRISAITTGSLSAIRAYLDGERYLRRTQWDSAIVAFERALDRDSTFALAAVRLAHAYGWRDGTAAARPYRELAARHADALPERARSLLTANNLFFIESALAAHDSVLAYTTRYPDDPAGWFLRGEIAFHGRAVLTGEPEAVYAPFDRVIELAPMLAPALIHPIAIAIQTGDTARLNRYLAHYRSYVPPDRFEPFRLARAFVRAPADSAVGILARYMIGTILEPDRFQGGLVDAMVRLTLLGEAKTPAVALASIDSVREDPRVNDDWRAHYRDKRRWIGLAAGRLTLARTIPNLDEELDTADRAFLLALPVFYGYPASKETRTARRLLESMGTGDAEYHVGLLMQVMLAVERGNTSAARRMVETLTALRNSEFTENVVAAVNGTALLLEGDTIAGLKRLQGAIENAGFSQDFIADYFRFRWASALAARPRTRAEGVRRLRYGFLNDFGYLPFAHLRIGYALEQAGDLDGAASAYERVLHLWSGAGPAVQPLVEDVRADLDRVRVQLAGSGGGAQ